MKKGNAPRKLRYLEREAKYRTYLANAYIKLCDPEAHVKTTEAICIWRKYHWIMSQHRDRLQKYIDALQIANRLQF